MRVKVFIEDGVIQGVMADEESDIEVKIVTFDSEYGIREQLDEEWNEDGFVDIPYETCHCEEEED